MQHYRIITLLFLLLLGLASCSPGHLGSNEIAFVRNGHLWTIDPDGANAFEIVAENTPVVGYAWSPTHQVLVYRSLDPDFAKTAAAKSLRSNPLTGTFEDLPSTLNTIGIDGGSPIPIMFSSPDILYSNPIWNSTGTRLLLRQVPKSPPHNPATALWWIAQNDQPGGIATKLLPSSYSIPSLAYTSSTAIENSEKGVFTTTLAGTDMQFLTHESLTGHPLPATLERILWQPAHSQPAILYAISTTSPSADSTRPFSVQLTLRAANGRITTLATCTCTQFAWSPDGNHVLYSTGSTYTILHLADMTSFTLSAENGSIPYWSPDSQFLLLEGIHTLTLVRIANKQQQILLSDTVPSKKMDNNSILPTTSALLQPVSNSPWAADSRHFLFLTHARLLWQGHTLSSGKGLYTTTITASGQLQGTPVVVDTGNDSQVGWTYEDANTSFLY
jgi:hypothetical protein